MAWKIIPLFSSSWWRLAQGRIIGLAALWNRYGSLSLNERRGRGTRLVDEAAEARTHDLAFVSYPILDRGVPSNTSTFSHLLETIHLDLEQGKNVLVHCRQGIGRTGLVAASLLVRDGMEPESAVQEVSRVRGVQIPETPAQEGCIYGIAASLK
jgi:protein tyrosine/serine phosphatase